MAKKLCCPDCGNTDLQIVTETNTTTAGGGYSAGKGCLGYILFGPLGLLCGACGQKPTTTSTNKTYLMCKNCGKKVTNPEDLRKKINSLNSNVFVAMCIIGAIFALVFLLIFAEAHFGVAMFVALLTFGIFALFGFISKKYTESTREKLENELRELEEKMNRFADE